MNTVRYKIFRIVEPDDSGSLASKLYDIFMLLTILASLSSLFTHESYRVLNVIDVVTCGIFIADYIVRWATADYKFGRTGTKPFLVYPFSFMAIIDLLSILPTLSLLASPFKMFRVPRLFKIFRIFKFIRYYEPFQIIIAVIRKQGKTLLAVLLFALSYILICAMIMFNIESGPSFSSFYDAIYWSCCTLTTVGYGDIYPVTAVGRAFSMISAIVGIALIALPSGIITSGYLDELRSRRDNQQNLN